MCFEGPFSGTGRPLYLWDVVQAVHVADGHREGWSLGKRHGFDHSVRLKRRRQPARFLPKTGRAIWGGVRIARTSRHTGRFAGTRTLAVGAMPASWQGRGRRQRAGATAHRARRSHPLLQTRGSIEKDNTPTPTIVSKKALSALPALRRAVHVSLADWVTTDATSRHSPDSSDVWCVAHSR